MSLENDMANVRAYLRSGEVDQAQSVIGAMRFDQGMAVMSRMVLELYARMVQDDMPPRPNVEDDPGYPAVLAHFQRKYGDQ